MSAIQEENTTSIYTNRFSNRNRDKRFAIGKLVTMRQKVLEKLRLVKRRVSIFWEMKQECPTYLLMAFCVNPFINNYKS